ncbi:MAG: DUF169 domain-containing protein, partial [Pseudomonadota bacterium]
MVHYLSDFKGGSDNSPCRPSGKQAKIFQWTFRSVVWVKTREDGKKYEASIPRLPLGEYEAVAMAPLVYNPFDPDIVLIYANPAQMMLLINSLQFEDYEVMQFYCVGE